MRTERRIDGIAPPAECSARTPFHRHRSGKSRTGVSREHGLPWLPLSVILVLAMCTCTGAEVPDVAGLGVVIERASGRVVIIDTVARAAVNTVTGLGDLSHASVVFSGDRRFAYVFGRDGGLTRLDMAGATISKRIIQAGNSIGGAINRAGTLIAVSNYEPGGVKIFDANTLDQRADIPAWYGDGKQRSRVVGLVDAPGERFIYSLFDAGEIHVVDMTDPGNPSITRYPGVGRQPYDALLTPDGRYYIAGLFGEDGFALLDLENPENGVRRILSDYGHGEQRLPVYKMPHLEGWAVAGEYAFVPAMGRHEVLVVDRGTWREVRRIPVHGQPVFAMGSPDGRQVWVNFALPDNDTLDVIDTASLEVIRRLQPGKAVLHMEFTPDSRAIWVSVRDENRVDVYDTASFRRLAQIAVETPSGIFFSARADRIGL